MEYCRIMRDLREDTDLTQQQVADYLGTSQTMYARYERGANELPIHHLLTLCRLYHVSSDYLLGLSPCKNIPGDAGPRFSGRMGQAPAKCAGRLSDPGGSADDSGPACPGSSEESYGNFA